MLHEQQGMGKPSNHRPTSPSSLAAHPGGFGEPAVEAAFPEAQELLMAAQGRGVEGAGVGGAWTVVCPETAR